MRYIKMLALSLLIAWCNAKAGTKIPKPAKTKSEVICYLWDAFIVSFQNDSKQHIWNQNIANLSSNPLNLYDFLRHSLVFFDHYFKSKNKEVASTFVKDPDLLSMITLFLNVEVAIAHIKAYFHKNPPPANYFELLSLTSS